MPGKYLPYRPRLETLEARSLLASAITPGPIPSIAQSMVLRSQSFDRAPRGWHGSNNQLHRGCTTTVQDFGYAATAFEDGSVVGRAGGLVSRATRAAYYADTRIRANLNDALTAEGLLTLAGLGSDGGFMLGFFRAASQGRGWRPANFLGIRIVEQRGSPVGFLEVVSATNKVHTVPLGPMPTDGWEPFRWRLTFDPQGASGRGVVSFSINDVVTSQTTLPAGFRKEGATFDRFGLSNVQVPGGAMEVYLDDVDVGLGEVETFDVEPLHWQGVGSRITYQDCERHGSHAFGYSQTSYAGGGRGELGGTYWRVEPFEPYGYFADKTEKLSLNDPLYASGTVAMTRASADSALYLGWFDARTISEKPRNFIGVVIEGPSRAGHYFRPRYGTRKAETGDADVGPTILADGQVHTWTFSYDPAANGGLGLIAVTLDDRRIELKVPPSHRKSGARFDRFGTFTMRKGGHYLTAYFDDLTYVAGKQRQILPPLFEGGVGRARR